MTFQKVCVYAGSAPGASEAYAAATRELAAGIVARGAGVVYGGGSLGLMGVLADATLQAGGTVTGVIPRFLDDREVGHDGVTDLRVVETMHERKMLMADLADAFVVLPGGIGTLEEVVELLSWRRLDLHAKPVVFYNPDGFWQPLFDLFQHTVDAHLTPAEFMDAWTAVERIEDVIPTLLQAPA
ncbi:MAG: hypothetical protein QOH30_1618, partial [Baekduia sp.]|nr:hypothetical protein [Baekduia sp.]